MNLWNLAIVRFSLKQKKFLSFVVEEILEDRAPQLKGYTIAVTVYGRPAGFGRKVPAHDFPSRRGAGAGPN